MKICIIGTSVSFVPKIMGKDTRAMRTPKTIQVTKPKASPKTRLMKAITKKARNGKINIFFTLLNSFTPVDNPLDGI